MKFELVKEYFDENYSKVFSYLKVSKKFIFFSIILFGVFFIFGLFLKVPESFSEYFLEYVRDLLLKTEGLGFFGMLEFIFFNNVWVGFLSIILGTFFGIFPIMSLIVNGFFLGYVSKISILSEGFFSLWRLLPHGIFELPAIFLCFGLGIKMGSFIFQEDSYFAFKTFLRESLRVFLFLVIPLLVLAGIIESFLIVFF